MPVMLSSDSRGKPKEPQWVKRLQIIDSTTMTLFSNLIFKGVGRNPRRGKKKGGIKVHTMIHANEGVSSDIRCTSAATHDPFMLSPYTLDQGAIIAMDRAYIDYTKFEQMTQLGITYVTKMKTGLNYEVLKGDHCMDSKMTRLACYFERFAECANHKTLKLRAQGVYSCK